MLVFFVVLICLLINGVYSTIWKPVSLKWSAESGIYDAQRCGLPLSNSAVANKTKSETNLTSPTTKPTRFKRFHEELEDENRHQKIMGGTDATDGELPWAVALYLKDRYICTGTLITKKHVITAGHCFGNEKSQDAGGCKDTDYLPVQEMLDQLEVWTGGVCLPQTACNSTHKMVKHLVKKVTYQPFFQQRCREGDMALLELDDEVDPCTTNHICLPQYINSTQLVKHEDWQKQAVPLVFGWGLDPNGHPDDNAVPNLQKLDIDYLMKPEACNASWDHVPQDAICTAELADKNACSGDSGGGIISRFLDDNRDHRYFLLGMTSFGSDCIHLSAGNEARAQIYTGIINQHHDDISSFIGL